MEENVVVAPLLPQCLDGSLTQADFDDAAARQFSPDSWDYYQNVLPSTVPGIVLGAISLIAFLFFLIWIMVQHCSCCATKSGRPGRCSEDEEMDARFMRHSEGSLAAATIGKHFEYQEKHACSCTRVTQIFIVLITLSTVGVSSWGIAASLQNTDEQITNFWKLVDDIESKANNTTSALGELSGQMQQLEEAVAILDTESGRLSEVAIQLGIGSPEVLSAINNLDDVESTLQTAHKGVDQGLAQVESNMNAVMDTLHNDFRDPSYSFENTWRFVVIAVLFGLNILSSLMAGVFSIQVGRPIFASFSVALLWFTVTLLMLFGVGLLRGVVVVSTDACLYTETFMRGLVQTRVTNLERREFVLRAFDFYLSPAPTEPQPPGYAISAVTGVDLLPAYSIAQNPALGALASLAASPDAVAVLTAVLQPNTIAALQSVATLIDPIVQTLTRLDAESSHETVVPLYSDVKSFICCDIGSASQELFISWTTVGCLGFVLALLCSWRIVRHTLKSKQKAR